jgi:hypothetical protein
MLRIKNWGLCLVALALVAGTCLGQDAISPKFYKLDFVVKEVEGAKVLNARAYSVVVTTDVVSTEQHPCSIRTISKVPMSNGSGGYGLYDLGVSVDCRSPRETPGGLTLRVDADISSVPQESTTPSNYPPTVRQNKWTSSVVVPLRKPTVIFSSDDLTTKRQMQLELTATPIT